MKIIRGLHNLSNLSGCVATIGNFDGVHLGHQKILKSASAKAKSLRLPLVVISFVPSPQSFFNRPQPTLSSFKEKHFLLESFSVDEHLIINFNRRFSEVSAEQFLLQTLIGKLKMSYCFIGDDFRFGKNRVGNFNMLKEFSKRHNYIVENSSSILHRSKRISSSTIRSLLLSGGFALANEMLGREFSITGKIVHGDKRGRTIGFPTINVPIRRCVSPVLGVFAVKVCLGGMSYYGVCNIGKRPTFGGEKTLLEVYIFNFDEQVYGLQVTVTFKLKIREEKRFGSFEDLKQQILLDTQSTKDYFKI